MNPLSKEPSGFGFAIYMNLHTVALAENLSEALDRVYYGVHRQNKDLRIVPLFVLVYLRVSLALAVRVETKVAWRTAFFHFPGLFAND